MDEQVDDYPTTFQDGLKLLGKLHEQDISNFQMQTQNSIHQLELKYNQELQSMKENYESKIKQYQAQMVFIQEKCSRSENHVEKMMVKCTKLSEKLNEIKKRVKWNQPNEVCDRVLLDVKDKTINQLTKENVRLFNKIGQEREEFKNQIYTLNEKLKLLESKTNDIETGGDINSEPNKSHVEIFHNELDTVFNSITKQYQKTKQSPRKNKPPTTPSSNKKKDWIEILTSPILLLPDRPPTQLEDETPDNLNQLSHSPTKTTLKFNNKTEPILTPKTNDQKKSRYAEKKESKKIVSPKSRNKDYVYEEVVRDKDTRKQMHGVDCPCCKDVITISQDNDSII
ncbi:hypothetical protein BC833DRAFT_588614, partial [Globomyces pollinis-pini]